MSGVCAMNVSSACSTALDICSGTMASSAAMVPCGSVPIRVSVTVKPGLPPVPSIADRSTPTPLPMLLAAGGVFFIWARAVRDPAVLKAMWACNALSFAVLLLASDDQDFHIFDSAEPPKSGRNQRYLSFDRRPGIQQERAIENNRGL